MQPDKKSENAANSPVFRRTIRIYGLLSDPRKIEFLRTFVSGEGCEVVARSAGCSYEDIVPNLGDRYGQPTTVAVSPKLGNRDFNGLRNFAELKSVPLKD